MLNQEHLPQPIEILFAAINPMFVTEYLFLKVKNFFNDFVEDLASFRRGDPKKITDC